MKYTHYLLLALCSLLPVAAGEDAPAASTRSVLSPQESGYPEKVVQLHVSPEGKESLRTPVARYKNAEGRTVDLVGAIHLADARYYKALNRSFAKYDKMLYEMLDGEDMPEMIRISRKMEKGTATPEERQRFNDYQNSRTSSTPGKMLGGYYAYMAKVMHLSLQSEVVDYGLENWVHADMNSEEFAAAMAERGESWYTLVFDTLKENGASHSNSSILSGFNAKEMRRMVCRQLADSAEGSRSESRAIIISRNEKCFQVLDRVLAEHPEARRLCIFYGAMHLRDMHRRLLDRGFELQGVQWITAVRVD